MIPLSSHVPRRREGNLPALVSAIARAGEEIAREVARAGIAGRIGSAGKTNVQGEEVQELDAFADEVLAAAVAKTGEAAGIVSEESPDPVFPPEGAKGAFVVAFDPLDGSSNIDVNVSIGSIFSVHRRRGPDPGPGDFLQPGAKQIAAGYLVYGPSTTLTYSAGEGVHTFTLDRDRGEFVLTRADVKMPARGKTFSTNEGNSAWWRPGMRRFMEWVKGVDPASGRPYTGRYVGSLVADFHRTLLKGGIFLYPADTKDQKKPEGKLRLLYECAPIAFVAEQAGGAASAVEGRVLDLVPRDFHQRCPLIVGSREDVAKFDECSRG